MLVQSLLMLALPLNTAHAQSSMADAWTAARALAASTRGDRAWGRSVNRRPDGAIRSDERVSRRIDAIVAEHLSAGGPGAVVGVVRDGKILFRQGYGYADIARKTPLTSGMRFDLASVSKQFTAMAVMILAERGEVALGRPAGDYLPEFSEALDPRARSIRVVDLLHMVEGLADYTELGGGVDYHHMTNEDAARIMLAEPLLFAPRTRYHYSNTAYNMLGLLVKRVSGVGLGEFLRTNVFRPLGMFHSVVLDHLGQVIPGRADGYAKKNGAFEPARNDTEQLVGDGNLFSTVDDLLRWDQALFDRPPVSPAMLARAWTSGRLADGTATHYGFGWEISQQGRVVSHEGGWIGTCTYNRLDREKKLAVVVLSNDEGFPSDAVGDRIAELWR
jgi:CubicO group peptidase (beta-lactamase class C family)